MTNLGERIALLKYQPLPIISIALGIYGQIAFLSGLMIPATPNSTWVVAHYLVFYFLYSSTILAEIGAILKDPGYVEAEKEKEEPLPCDLWGIKSDETTLELVLRHKLRFKKRCEEARRKFGHAEFETNEAEDQRILSKVNVPRKPNRPILLALREIMGKNIPTALVIFPMAHLLYDGWKFCFGESKQRSESINSIKHL
ncbi:hypothetical protein Ciccas_002070 [Cichlidogyrus casuarinus]|uniref:Uncharacterized protein n=1 Tax=Cichlidogyrus casuarinus TaxID=1844966 RepID=A0ABD2QI92_9PLAT